MRLQLRGWPQEQISATPTRGRGARNKAGDSHSPRMAKEIATRQGRLWPPPIRTRRSAIYAPTSSGGRLAHQSFRPDDREERLPKISKWIQATRQGLLPKA